MLRIALAQLRGAPGRTLALVLAIAVATTSFTLLTTTVATNRLQVRGTVDATFRNSYDLLVRPTSSYTPRELAQGLVRPNYQSGIFGGITPAQLAAVRAVNGVEIAAPVANLGYVNLLGSVTIDLRPLLSSASAQLFRVRPVFTMDRGLSRFQGTPIYVYVSRRKAVLMRATRAGLPKASYGAYRVYAERVPGRPTPVASCTNYAADQTEVRDRREGPDATYSATPWGYRDPYAYTATSMSCFYLPTRPDPRAAGSGASDPAHLQAVVPVSLPVLLTAIDPAAENALSGLDRSITSGRNLSTADGPPPPLAGTSGQDTKIPVLAATHTSIDQEVSTTVERVRPGGGNSLTDVLAQPRGLLARLGHLPATTLSRTPAVPASSTWGRLAAGQTVPGVGLRVGTYWQVGPSGYTGAGGSLRVTGVPNPGSAYVSPQLGDPAPVGSDDSGVRRVTEQSYRQGGYRIGKLEVVGRFDASTIVGDNELSGLTSQTYASPLLPGADAASRAALGNLPLAPSSDVAGYAAQPPSLLTTLGAASFLLSTGSYGKPSDGAVVDAGTDRADPISVIRVRVAGVTGPDPVSRERLDQAALAIGQRTGLAVDIVAGASGVPTTVALPGGRHGRPELRLSESWARKGLAYAVISAVDRKSLTLFVLILTVCTLMVANAASASVRTRRVGLGVLSCLGWRPARLFGAVMVELAAVGLAAGLLGAGASLVVSHLADLAVTPARALLTVPPAVLLATLAGLAPAARAARSAPMDAVRPLVRAPRRARRTRTVVGLALRGLIRTPGRTALAAVTLATGIAALTVLLTVQQAFRGLVVGSLLGDAVALQVRGPDVVALAAILALGALAVADVLYLSVREQAGELALLRATGWPEPALGGLVAVQGLGLGVLGGLLGVLAGLGAVIGLAGAVPAAVVGPILLALGAGVVLAAIATLVPSLLVRRLPTTILLAEEPA